ncbi:MAG: excinuclease ABC subunit UvrA [Candidatus Goldbacteria bacterium]|nr:excinuclease ABC subunit UvrA [Candidatus Goldiibacteriota bacterium]
MAKDIVIKGAREHNLKNIDITLPRDKFIVLTGVSGSGKSSLAFDTIYAEGQRRYMESLSAYSRMFLGQMQKPDVDVIEGLSPAIAIEQKSAGNNPRSTVGTITEIYDYLRLLYARIGVPHCPNDGTPIKSQTVQMIVDKILTDMRDAKIMILAPVVSGRKGEYHQLFDKIKKEGFLRVRVNGELKELDTDIKLEKNKKHSIEIVVDRLEVKPDIKGRLTQSVELAIKLAEGAVIITDFNTKKDTLFSEKLSCPKCGFSMAKLQPRMFSFNNPFGACSECTGLGTKIQVDEKLILEPKLSLKEGALKPWRNQDGYYWQMLASLGRHLKFSFDVPFEKLPEKAKKAILYGLEEDIKFDYKYKSHDGEYKYTGGFEGLVPFLERRYRETSTEKIREDILGRYMSEKPCHVCGGKRLKPESLSVLINGKSIIKATEFSIEKAYEFFTTLKLNERDAAVAKLILKEIKGRLEFLLNVGLSYLTLERKAGTLSGGEFQRIHLANQIGVGLMGVLYILDEPSIGLHQRDNMKLIQALQNLRDLGNTVIVVEHDEETMLHCDYIVDMGPGPGVHGGEVVCQGTLKEIMKCKNSLTAGYLMNRDKIQVNKQRRPAEKFVEISGVTTNNLKNVSVKFPLGSFVAVTGVSGSGKSSLIGETFYPALLHKVYHTNYKPDGYKELNNWHHIDKVIEIDQSPIGRTPRSNAATYTGVFSEIRDLFSETKESKMRGYESGRFSFNVKGGRCEACAGDGIIKIEMHFLPDVYVPCEECGGKRYNRETLEILYKNKNIHEILDMRVEDAMVFFQNIPNAYRVLKTMDEVGLGYIKLGQSATTLSGGEAQRIKLATELCKRSTGQTLYILDEPTTGLHFADIEKLLHVLNELVERGNTVIVIEHNLDVIKNADYVIDLGPEGGDKGGNIVVEGTPEEVMQCAKSYTGQYLKKHVNVTHKASDDAAKPIKKKKTSKN